jgi:hypothetical protein
MARTPFMSAKSASITYLTEAIIKDSRLIVSAYIRKREHEEGNESEGTTFNYISRFKPLDATSFYRPF